MKKSLLSSIKLIAGVALFFSLNTVQANQALKDKLMSSMQNHLQCIKSCENTHTDQKRIKEVGVICGNDRWCFRNQTEGPYRALETCKRDCSSHLKIK